MRTDYLPEEVIGDVRLLRHCGWLYVYLRTYYSCDLDVGVYPIRRGFYVGARQDVECLEAWLAVQIAA